VGDTWKHHACGLGGGSEDKEMTYWGLGGGGIWVKTVDLASQNGEKEKGERERQGRKVARGGVGRE
jgi:hypothetical protein